MRALVLVLVACSSSPPPAPAPAPVPHVPPVSIDAAAVVDAAVAVAIDAPPPAPAFAMRKLSGPHKSLRAYCASIKPEDIDDEAGRTIKCDTAAMSSGKRKLDNPSAPWDEARIFVVEGLDPHCQLGIRIGKDWYVLHHAVRCLGERAKSTLSNKVTTFAIEGPHLVLRAVYDQSMEEYSPREFDRTHFETLVLCGVNAGVPSCTREIPIRGTREEFIGRKKPKKTQFELIVNVVGNDLVIAGDTTGIEHYLFEPLAADTYTLAF